MSEETLTHHHHHHDGHHHHDDGNEPAAMLEQPLDPANQSLADALRASFRVLKFIMFLLLILYVLSGGFIVDKTQVAVVTRFGQQQGSPRQPGLHWTWPRPIDGVIKLSTAPKNMNIDAFWLKLSESDKSRELSDLSPRSQKLEPDMDGAVLTGDRAIMHMLCNVQYHIEDANAYVRNVGSEEQMIRSVMQNAIVAQAARTSVDVIRPMSAQTVIVRGEADQLGSRIQERAQQRLDALKSGIQLENVAVVNSYFPLQTKEEFLGVTAAQNRKLELINEAESERTKRLLGVAGPAWKELAAEIQKLEQVPDGEPRNAIIARINEILQNEATGEAGGRIKLAESTREGILADTRGQISMFEAYLPEYLRSPQLTRDRLRTETLNHVYAGKGVTKWLLPPGDKQIVPWFSKDPLDIRQAEKDRITSKVSGK